MCHDSQLPARRSLLARPQRLGFLPTLWFWNDAARQWLIAPIVLATAIPLTLLVQQLAVRFPALAAPLFVLVAIYPFALMGLVERHVRRQLRTRPLAEPPTRDDDRDDRRGRAVPVVVAALCAVLLALAARAGTALLVALAVAGGSLAAALLPRTWRALGRGVTASEPRPGLPPAPNEP
jgi:hypothetical protein